MNERTKWGVVVIYATAMAWVESAVVVYLRTLLDRIEPYQKTPLPHLADFGSTELIREAATLIMLATIGFLAGNTARKRIGYSLIAFGIWDIFYYLFLKVICGWPRSLLDWDILFLIPLPWWGPILAPMLIAFLMIVWGTAVTQFDFKSGQCPNAVYYFSSFGVFLALYTFMRDSLATLPQGEAGLREMLPTHFAWPLFSLALGLMALPVLTLFRTGAPFRPPSPESFALRDATKGGSGKGLIS
jgi:hypothetical protein